MGSRRPTQHATGVSRLRPDIAWIHCGYGHIDTSPAWDGQRPEAAQRAYYRHFAASLTDEQQFELGYALTKRA